jgi:hypothetical protein
MPTRFTDQASIEAPMPDERELIEAALAQTKGKVSGSLKINKYRFKDS